LRFMLPGDARRAQAVPANEPGQTASGACRVADLYRERYGDVEALELERHTREVPPPGRSPYGRIPFEPVTPAQAAANLRRLAEELTGLPLCLVCLREGREHVEDRDRGHVYTPVPLEEAV
jgi:hypothetical protein